MYKLYIKFNETFWDFQKELNKGKPGKTKIKIIDEEIKELNTHSTVEFQEEKEDTFFDVSTKKLDYETATSIYREVLYFARNRAFYSIELREV